MRIALRLNDDIGTALDAAADAESITRSRWIARLIERELGHSPPAVPPKMPRKGSTIQLLIRLDGETLQAIDALAADLGIRRNQWILRTLRAHAWTVADEPADYPVSAAAVGKLIEQVVRIGRNVNQAAHAINAAVMPGSELNLAQTTGHMLQMQQDIEEIIDKTERQLIEFAWTENRYWRGSARRGV